MFPKSSAEDVHSRDVIESFVLQKVNEANDFRRDAMRHDATRRDKKRHGTPGRTCLDSLDSWLDRWGSQLRFYWQMCPPGQAMHIRGDGAGTRVHACAFLQIFVFLGLQGRGGRRGLVTDMTCVKKFDQHTAVFVSGAKNVLRCRTAGIWQASLTDLSPLNRCASEESHRCRSQTFFYSVPVAR